MSRMIQKMGLQNYLSGQILEVVYFIRRVLVLNHKYCISKKFSKQFTFEKSTLSVMRFLTVVIVGWKPHAHRKERYYF
jgi:hypothetical protein